MGLKNALHVPDLVPLFIPAEPVGPGYGIGLGAGARAGGSENKEKWNNLLHA
jgi:hypothetical protein